jgi:aspartate aminotransferase-like enzyme
LADSNPAVPVPGSQAVRPAPAFAAEVEDPEIPEQLLMVPGPTPVPAAVRRYASAPLINHRSAAFTALWSRVHGGLREVFQTAHDVFVWPGSGTGALENAIVNCFSPGERVLSLPMGAFGERWAEIAEAFGLQVERLAVPYGEAPDADLVAERLEADRRGGGPPFAGVLVTFNETSTGVLVDLPRIAAAVRAHGALLLVDAVSGLGGADLRMDAWGCDVVVTGSQKALMTPPGLAAVAFGPRAWEAAQRARLPRSYWDWRPYKEKPLDPPYTPAVSLLYALDASLRRILAEGLPACFARHLALRAVARAAFPAAGFPLLAEDAVASPTVTAARLPQGVRFHDLAEALDRRGATIAGGMGPLRGQMLRIGHMGGMSAAMLLRFFAVFDDALRELGLPGAGAALPAAQVAAAQAGAV